MLPAVLGAAVAVSLRKERTPGNGSIARFDDTAGRAVGVAGVRNPRPSNCGRRCARYLVGCPV
jgi:hypothetical protein